MFAVRFFAALIAPLVFLSIFTVSVPVLASTRLGADVESTNIGTSPDVCSVDDAGGSNYGNNCDITDLRAELNGGEVVLSWGVPEGLASASKDETNVVGYQYRYGEKGSNLNSWVSKFVNGKDTGSVTVDELGPGTYTFQIQIVAKNVEGSNIYSENLFSFPAVTVSGDPAAVDAQQGQQSSQDNQSGDATDSDTQDPEASGGLPDPSSGQAVSSEAYVFKNPTKYNSLQELLLVLIDKITIIIMPFIVLAITYIGFRMVWAGREKNADYAQWKKAFAMSLVGLFLVLGARGILSVIQNTVGDVLEQEARDYVNEGFEGGG